ncbi:MAG TPA: HisA/HisF-related TIM barrel protein [Fimbriiglobus sp.]|nr:HisA/HisF-related TIM barrel protein [Fimbriiglobus sp.]
MRIIPVIDVMGGVVVRAVGGQRAEYRPVRSRLVDSVEPLVVARALLELTGADDLYVADLDAITRSGVNTASVRGLCGLGPRIWIDTGIRTDDDLERVPQGPNVVAVFGTETVERQQVYIRAIDHRSRTGVALSIDMVGRVFLGNHRTWSLRNSDEIWWVAEQAYHVGCLDIILLDLHDVGSGNGPSTAGLCCGLKRVWPDMRIVTGGGIRDWDDVKRLEDAGADAVLVASALHDGTLTFPRPVS